MNLGYSDRRFCISEISIGQVAERDLILRTRAGDDRAWQELMGLHQEAVFRLGYLILGDADAAADVAQETFLRAYHALHRFDLDRPLRPWLLRIASNHSKNWLRALGRYMNTLKRFADLEFTGRSERRPAERKLYSRQISTLTWEAIRKLDPTDQQIIFLRYFLDLPVAEAADALGVRPGTVKSRLHRALARLRRIIESEYSELIEDARE